MTHWILEDLFFVSDCKNTMYESVKEKKILEKSDMVSLVDIIVKKLESYKQYIVSMNDAITVIDEIMFQFLLKEFDLDLDDDSNAEFRKIVDETLHLVSVRFSRSSCYYNKFIRFMNWLADEFEQMFLFESDYRNAMDTEGEAEGDDDDVIDAVLVD